MGGLFMNAPYEIYRCSDCKPETKQYFEDAKARAQELAEYHQCEVSVYKRGVGGLLEFIGHATPFTFGGES